MDILVIEIGRKNTVYESLTSVTQMLKYISGTRLNVQRISDAIKDGRVIQVKDISGEWRSFCFDILYDGTV